MKAFIVIEAGPKLAQKVPMGTCSIFLAQWHVDQLEYPKPGTGSRSVVTPQQVV